MDAAATIVHKILNMIDKDVNVDTICLSDTCGTLTCDDFEYIVDTIYHFGIPYNKMSLHLHVNPNREKEVEQIFFRALERNITNFDASFLETGGCSMTISSENLRPNLSYEQYYKFLLYYLEIKSSLRPPSTY